MHHKRNQLRDNIRRYPHLLDRLSNKNAAEMLRAHYIDGVEWHKIAERYSYSIDNIMVIRRKAVTELQQMIESEAN